MVETALTFPHSPWRPILLARWASADFPPSPLPITASMTCHGARTRFAYSFVHMTYIATSTGC
jgi:hypothetical protein